MLRDFYSKLYRIYLTVSKLYKANHFKPLSQLKLLGEFAKIWFGKNFRWLFLLDRPSVITMSNTQLSFRHIPHPFGILQADTVDMEAICHIQSVKFQHSFSLAPKVRVILADVPSILLNSLFLQDRIYRSDE